MSSDRIVGLDIIRTIAITLVIISHSTPILAPLSELPRVGNLIHKLLEITQPFGILGVELFFVLSGFLIGSILIRIFTASASFGYAEIRSFLIRRWFRTLPNYWLILILNFIVYSALHQHSFGIDYLRYFIFIQNLWYRPPLFFPESWSLSVEEWFYLTLPVGLFLFAFLFKKKEKKTAIIATIIFYAVFFFLLRLLVPDYSITDNKYANFSVRMVTFFRLDAISYGVLIAYLNKFHREQLMKHKKTLMYSGIAGSVLISGIHYAGIHPAFAFYERSLAFRYFTNGVQQSLIPALFCMVLPYASTVRSIRGKFLSNVFTTISKISYSMYLVHFTLVMRAPWNYIKITWHNCIFIYIAYWALVIAISYLLFTFFELPVANLRDKITRKESIN